MRCTRSRGPVNVAVIRLKEVMRIRFSLLCFFIFVTVVAVVSVEAARHLIAIAEERSERDNSLRLIALEAIGDRSAKLGQSHPNGSFNYTLSS